MRQNLVSRASVLVIALIAAGWSITSHALVVSIDEFTIIRNGTTFFTDSFTDGNEPPSAPNFVGGGVASYFVFGTIPSTAEAGDRLLLDTAGGVPALTANGLTRRVLSVTLLTDTSTNLDLGLKSNDTLSLSGIFSLTIPSGPLPNGYGISLTDIAPGQPEAHQILQMDVAFNAAFGPLPVIRYLFQDFDANTITALGFAVLAPPLGADEILLNLSRLDITNDNIFGSYAYVTGGVVGASTQFSTPGHGFQGEDFVRAYFINFDTVPEPATLALFGLGLAGLGFSRRRKSVQA